jgi:hypothetical protein
MVGRMFRAVLSVTRLFVKEFYQSADALKIVLMYTWSRAVKLIVLQFKSMKVKEQMIKVRDYKSWQKLAKLLDQIEGLLEWKLK